MLQITCLAQALEGVLGFVVHGAAGSLGNLGRLELGDADITFPVVSNAASIEEILTELEQTKVPERAGRALDHETEDAFERLRVAGYL